MCLSCYIVLSVPCSLVVTCKERADFLALLYKMFFSVFVTFPYGIQGQVWQLIVSNPELCLLPYFALHTHVRHMKHLSFYIIYRRATKCNPN